MEDESPLSPLELQGWLEFNRLRWGVQPLRVRYASRGELPVITSVLYLGRRGRIVLPRLNPYLPLAFGATPTSKPFRRERQWLEVASQMACDMRKRGLRGLVNLPPEVTDARPWRWAGFRVGVAYTYYVDFPLHLDAATNDVRRRIAKAQRMGYRAERTLDMADVLAPLQETEDRQHFHLRLSLQDLELARKLLGDEHLRACVGYAPDGAPASACVALHVAGGTAIGWVTGTRTEHLATGIVQLCQRESMRDLQAVGASGLDLAGANIPAVAAAKVGWGVRLVPYSTVEPSNVRTLSLWLLEAFRSWQTARGKA